MPRKTSVERQIRQQQNSVQPIVPWTAFCRLTNEVLGDVTDQGGYNIRSEAVRALQCASEDMLVTLFSDAERLAAYTGRETVNESDLLFLRRAATSAPDCDAEYASLAAEPVPVDS